MALRDQPYLPLYVQDFLTDEKLIECSASATGVYIRLMCIMHKSDEYGVILLHQKDQQSTDQIKNFATKLLRHLPYTEEIIYLGLKELIDEKVLSIKGDKLSQGRMVSDNELSKKRAEAGKKGGFATKFAKEFAIPKTSPNTEYEYVNENEVNNSLINVEWIKWKEYKRAEFGFKYKSEISEKSAKAELLKLSNNNEEEAIKIIQQSMANGWKGFFKLKNEMNGNNGKPVGASNEAVARIIARNFGEKSKQQ